MKSLHFLFLDPFAAVGGYHRSLVALGRELRRLGHKMTFVHCNEAMATGCTGMNALGVADEASTKKKQEICKLCLREARATEKIGLWETRWLLPRTRVIRKDMSSTVRRSAAYELLMQKKFESIPPKGPFRKNWFRRQDRLWGILPQAERLLSEKKIDGVVCYNSLYGVHHLFLKLAKEKGIPTLCLHHSFNCAREDEYVLFRGHVFEFLNRIRTSFDAGRPLTLIEKRAVEDHSRALMAGRKPWAYSLPIGNLEPSRMETKFTRKVLVCLSSPDENFAAEFLGVLPRKPKHAFPNQISWIRWIRKMALRYPYVLFWIRPHPRLYPNKRESQKSELAARLEKERGKPSPENFFWPPQDEQGSVWSHLRNTNVVFNAWSSLADDFGKKGIPVITFFPFWSNSHQVIDNVANKISHYEKLFQKILKKNESNNLQKKYTQWQAKFLCTNNFVLKTTPSLTIRLSSLFQTGLNKIEKKAWALTKIKQNHIQKERINTILNIVLKNVGGLNK